MIPEKPGTSDGVYYSFEPSPQYIILANQICGVIITIGCVLLCGCHVGRSIHTYKIIKRENKICAGTDDGESVFPSKLSKDKLGVLYYYIYGNHLLTFLALFCGIIHAVNVSLYYVFDIYLIIGCDIALKLSAFGWQFVRYAIYWIGILRILITFHGLAIDYSKTFKRILLIYMSVSNLYVLITHFVLSKGYDMITNNIPWCQYGVLEITTGIGAILELTTNIILLVLFIIPLIRLSKNLESNSES